MGFLEHLDELRKRIIRSCIAIGAGMLVAFFFVERIGDFILGPTLATLPAGDTLIYTKPGEGIAFYLDIAFIGGLVLAAPFVMYQVWRFIAPGLYAREKRFAIPFVVLTSVGSIGGALFTHYIMFPSTMAFLGTFHSSAMKFVPRVEDTFALYKGMMIGMVLVFQLPTLVFFLAKMRLVTARFLWRNIKYAILIIFIVAAVLTSSPDPWNQTIFAVPMIGLYLISIGIAWIVAPKREKESAVRSDSQGLRLVIGAMILDQARNTVRKEHHMRALLVVIAALAAATSCRAPAQGGAGAVDRSAEEIIALERAALDRWMTADPDGYLALYVPDVTYFDPTRERRVDGLEAMQAFLAPIKGTKLPFREPRYDMIAPKVQLYGDVALLTFNLVSYGKLSDAPETVLARWNSTEVYRRIDGTWKIVHSHWSYTKPELKQAGI